MPRLRRSGIGGALIASIGSFRKSGRVTKLQDELTEAILVRDSLQNAYSTLVDQYRYVSQDIIRLLLTQVASNLSLGDSERISLYGHNGNSFILAGRFSKHPEYQKPGRAFYPDNQGCIGKAWYEGACFVDDLPDPNTNKKAWMNAMERDWRIPKAVSKAFSMKSRCFVAQALDSSLHGGRRAVVMVESVHCYRLSKTCLEKVAAQLNQSVKFLEIMETFEPNPQYAKDEGY